MKKQTNYLKEEEKALYTKLIRSRLKESAEKETFGALDIENGISPIFRQNYELIIDALALGCTLSKPRMFSGKLMVNTDFRRIAEKMTYAKACRIIDALIKNHNTIKNPTWYILGMCAR